MKRPTPAIAVVLALTLPLAACGGQNATSVRQIGDKCSTVSAAVEYKEDNDSILYDSGLEDPTPGAGLPGLDCLADSLGVTVNDIHDEVPNGGSGHLSTGEYSVGIYSTGKDLVLSISDKD